MKTGEEARAVPMTGGAVREVLMTGGVVRVAVVNRRSSPSPVTTKSTTANIIGKHQTFIGEMKPLIAQRSSGCYNLYYIKKNCLAKAFHFIFD